MGQRAFFFKLGPRKTSPLKKAPHSRTREAEGPASIGTSVSFPGLKSNKTALLGSSAQIRRLSSMRILLISKSMATVIKVSSRDEKPFLAASISKIFSSLPIVSCSTAGWQSPSRYPRRPSFSQRWSLPGRGEYRLLQQSLQSFVSSFPLREVRLSQ